MKCVEFVYERLCDVYFIMKEKIMNEWYLNSQEKECNVCMLTAGCTCKLLFNLVHRIYIKKTNENCKRTNTVSKHSKDRQLHERNLTLL